MSDIPKITPTLHRLLTMFSDGMPHTIAQLGECLSDDLGNIKTNVRLHLVKLRKIVRPRGQEIVCEIYNRKLHYRHVRLLKDQNLYG